VPVDTHPAPDLRQQRCSVAAGQTAEPLAGTAAVASTWLCIEQPGPWGPDALQGSHLDVGVGRTLADRARGTGVRVALIRRPGPHPDRHREGPRAVYLAHTVPGRTWLERATVGDVRQLLDIDLTAAGAGTPAGLGERVTGPLLLICTNGRRDVCCALLGRPIAAGVADRHGDAVWECTHLGGHRFAPTGLVLPGGYAYGRLDLATARRLLAPGDEILVAQCRGRSTWTAPGQVADLAVRASSRTYQADAVWVSEVEPSGSGRWHVRVGHRDGRRWRVVVAQRAAADLRPASCGAAPTPLTVLDAGLPELSA
jgi:hypothetical protein